MNDLLEAMQIGIDLLDPEDASRYADDIEEALLSVDQEAENAAVLDAAWMLIDELRTLGDALSDLLNAQGVASSAIEFAECELAAG